jgi:hypothetical protein
MPCEYYRRGGATGLRVPACLVSHGRGRSCLAGQLFRLGLSSNLQDTAVTATNFPLEARELAVVALRGSGRLLLWAVRSRASGIPDDWQARSHLSPFFRGTAGGATNGSAIRLIGRLSPGKRLPKCHWPSYPLSFVRRQHVRRADRDRLSQPARGRSDGRDVCVCDMDPAEHRAGYRSDWRVLSHVIVAMVNSHRQNAAIRTAAHRDITALLLGWQLAAAAEPVDPRGVVEEKVFSARYSNNGASPMWCFGNTCLVRLGDRVFASIHEPLPGQPGPNDCRWSLFDAARCS